MLDNADAIIDAPYQGDSNAAGTAGLSGTNSTAGDAVFAKSAGGLGVHAVSSGGLGSVGVYGECTGPSANKLISAAGAGVMGGTNASGATGVLGISDAGVGVWGVSSSGSSSGVKGTSSAFDAVVGETNSDAHAGVTGRNKTSGANGGVGVYGTGGQFAGKFDGNVLINGNPSIGNAISVSGDVSVIGQLGVDKGSARYAISAAGSSLFSGDVEVTGSHTVGGDVHVTGDVVLSGGDCAEEFDIATTAKIEPGTVVVLDENGTLRASDRAYDKRVAGVISGAGDYRPGLILDRHESAQNRAPVALVGKVYCKVDAQYGPVEVGDLLTSSATPGHAMKASDPLKAFGGDSL